ncbi:MAG TPA: Ig-like domain-containing protein [Pyrinomonadaceae bacterium]|nr:Ig-like domain-containing protein [Pyrinomonadaceae bacterium]
MAHSQNPPPPPTLQGQSQTVILVPHSTVNAGPVHFKPDSDHDGMPDQDEEENGTDPNDPSDADGDEDGDGLSNGDEVAAGSGVNNADSDGDGVSDGDEARLGFNPSDPGSTPPVGATLVALQVAPANVGLVINSLLGQQPVQLTVTGTLSDGSTVDLTHAVSTSYRSLNTTIALIDNTGVVFGVAVGAAAVEARNGLLTARAAVNVAPFTPVLLSSLQLAGDANNVDVSGNTAYVAVGNAGLQVLDVSDRRAPHSVATFDTPGHANDVRVVGSTVYIADGASGLRIIDVSDPAHPALRGAVDTPGDARDVVVYGTRAYVADGTAGLQVIDVSNPAAPTILRTVDTPGNALGVDVAGNIAVVSDGFPVNGVRVIDLTNLAAAQIVGQISLTSNAEDVVTRGTLAYVAGTSGGLIIVDYSTPSSPFIAGRHTLPANGAFFPNDIELAGNFVLAAETRFTNAIPIDDVSNPTNPVYRGALDFTSSGNFDGRGIALDPLYVYMTAVGSTSRIFIAQYQTGDTQGVPPTVTMTAPTAGQTLLEGQTVTLAANAADDVGLLGVQFTSGGANAGAFSATAPYSATYVVPNGVSSLTLRAEAYDMGANRTVSEPVSVNVIPDPGTTVVGRVVDRLNQPIANATVKVFGRFSGVTGADGRFSFYAPSVLDSHIRAIVEAERNGQEYTGLSASVPLVVSGVTDLGDIVARAVSQLAFVHRPSGSNSEIYLMNSKGENKVRLTTNDNREFEPVFSPDGTKIIFNRDDNCNGRNVTVMDADGGNQIVISPGRFYTWSPDSRFIAYEFNQAIYISRADGSEKRKVTPAGRFASNPSWSPDGTKIAFLGWGSDFIEEVYISNTDGTGQQKLTTDGAQKQEAAWSPDGRFIAYIQRTSSGIFDVYVVSPGGGVPTKISGSDAFNWDLVWLPDGSGVLTTYEGINRNGSSIYLFDPAGGAPRQITNNGDVWDWGPSVSQDGSKLAYASDDGLFVVNIDGTDNKLISINDWDPGWRPEVVPVTDPGTTVTGRVVDAAGAPVSNATVKVFGATVATSGADGTFSVTGVSTLKGNVSVVASATVAGRVVAGYAAPAAPVPGGATQVGDVRIAERVIFISDRDGKSEIYLMDPDGSNQQRVTSNDATETRPALSPDRTRIAYATNVDGRSEIYVANLDGTSPKRVTFIQNSCSGSFSPAWSPDGAKLVFSAQPNFATGSEIFVVNADGTDLRRLTTNSAANSMPTWSADGTRIAFVSFKDGPFDLYYMNTDGSNQTRVTVNNLMNEQEPVWSPDGMKLAFAAWKDGFFQIFVINTDGTNQVQLTTGSNNSDYPAWSPDGLHIMFSTNRDGNYELYTMNPDGTNLLRLTTNNAGDFQPSW